MSDSTLLCSFRKQWVAAFPEEIVRQRLLHHMITKQGYPASLVAVEQSLRDLPHLSASDRQRAPKRRADIICFAKQGTSLHPLLLVECKAVKLTPKIMNQIAGYNHFVGARYLCIANQEEVRTGWYDQAQKDYVFINYLPSYDELSKVVRPSRPE